MMEEVVENGNKKYKMIRVDVQAYEQMRKMGTMKDSYSSIIKKLIAYANENSNKFNQFIEEYEKQ